VLHRSAALAAAMAGRRGVAVAGTHGKTTTTSMLTTILRHAGADPSYVIGGILAETGLGAADGGGGIFVAEADESDGSFLNLAPQVTLAVVTCVEADHLDNWASLAEIEAAFAAFAARIPPGGTLIVCADDPGCARLAAAAARPGLRLIGYGVAGDAGYQVSGIAVSGMSTRLTVTPGPGAALPAGVPLRVTIAVPGRHNALNAAAALAAAAELGTGAAEAVAGLAAYRGAQRRMEPKGEADGVRVLDSYAHHPTELAADLAAAREVAAGGRVIAVFQPHLFSRTRLFAGEFGAALGLADEAVVLDVYPAREDPEPGVTGELVARAVPGGALYLPDAAAVPAAAAGLAKPGDLVLTMGAGDVTRLGPLIVDVLRARSGEAG
jgi:UDP-N-acetylmuramate--alanine ligase